MKPTIIYEEGFPYSKGYAYTWQGESLVKQLFTMLPHGSRINYDWSVYQHKSNSNRFTAHNVYSAMNEWGMYCHTYPFSVTFDYDPTTKKFVFVRFSFKGNREYSCCGFGILEYLKDEMFYALEFRQDKE